MTCRWLIGWCAVTVGLSACAGESRRVRSAPARAETPVPEARSVPAKPEAASEPVAPGEPASPPASSSAFAPSLQDESSSGVLSPPSPEITAELPTVCASRSQGCAPPSDFVARLCRGKYPSVALYMFQRKTPWQRAYINRPEVNALNTVGGPVGESRLLFAEEVLILRRRDGGGGTIQVSGSTSYDALRWDGTCATLVDGEYVTYQPALPKAAPISWRSIDPSLQEALLANQGVRQARETYRKECRGLSVGGGDACTEANQALTRSVVGAVRRGMAMPLPAKVP
jgi:hypothetical protein